MVDHIVHYGVANMPGAVGRTSTYSLTNATLPFALELADLGYKEACAKNPGLAAGINIGLNLLWIPRFGILGAAWATLVSEIALLAVSQCYVWKNLGNTFRVGRWLRIATANAFVYAILFEAGAELSLAVRLPAAALAYVTCLLAFRVVVPRDLARWIQLGRVVAVGESQG